MAETAAETTRDYVSDHIGPKGLHLRSRVTDFTDAASDEFMAVLQEHFADEKRPAETIVIDLIKVQTSTLEDFAFFVLNMFVFSFEENLEVIWQFTSDSGPHQQCTRFFQMKVETY